MEVEDRVDRVRVVDEVVRQPRGLGRAALLGLAEVVEEVLVAEPAAIVLVAIDDLAAAEEDAAFVEVLVAEVRGEVLPARIDRVGGGRCGWNPM